MPFCLDAQPVEDLVVLGLRGSTRSASEWLRRALGHRDFVCLSRRDRVLSVVIGESFLKQVELPKDVEVEREWVSLRLDKTGLEHAAKLGAFGVISQALQDAGLDVRGASTPDAETLFLRKRDLPTAAAALLQAGHAIRPARRLCSAPASGASKGDRCRALAGAWRLVRRERQGKVQQEFAPEQGPVRLQAACGLFADVCVGDVVSAGASCAGFVETSSSSGSKADIVRHRLVDFQPPCGESLQATASLDGQLLLEAGSPDEHYRETWARLDPSQGCVAMELVSETPNRGAKRQGCWLFCGSLFARVVGLSMGQGLVSGTCCGSLRQLQRLHGEGAIRAELTKHYEAVFGVLEQPGMLRTKRQAWASSKADYFYDAVNGKGGQITLPQGHHGEELVHLLPDGSEQRWRVLEWSFDPFTPRAGAREAVLAAAASDSDGEAKQKRKKKKDAEKKKKKGGSSSSSSRAKKKEAKKKKERSKSRSGVRKRPRTSSSSSSGKAKAKKEKKAAKCNHSDDAQEKPAKRARSSSAGSNVSEKQKLGMGMMGIADMSRMPPPGLSAGGGRAHGQITINLGRPRPVEDPALSREAEAKMLNQAKEHANKFADMQSILKSASARMPRKEDPEPAPPPELLRAGFPQPQQAVERAPVAAAPVVAQEPPPPQAPKPAPVAAAPAAAAPTPAPVAAAPMAAAPTAAAPAPAPAAAAPPVKAAAPPAAPVPAPVPERPPVAPPVPVAPPEDSEEEEDPEAVRRAAMAMKAAMAAAEATNRPKAKAEGPAAMKLPTLPQAAPGHTQYIIIRAPGGDPNAPPIVLAVAPQRPPSFEQLAPSLPGYIFDPTTNMLVPRAAVEAAAAAAAAAALPGAAATIQDSVSRWLNENGIDVRAQAAMRALPLDMQHKVLADGPLTGTNHSAMLVARIRKVEQQVAQAKPAAPGPVGTVPAAAQAAVAVAAPVAPTGLPMGLQLPPGFHMAAPPGMPMMQLPPGFQMFAPQLGQPMAAMPQLGMTLPPQGFPQPGFLSGLTAAAQASAVPAIGPAGPPPAQLAIGPAPPPAGLPQTKAAPPSGMSQSKAFGGMSVVQSKARPGGGG